MATDFTEAGAQAASLAVKMGAAAVDAITFMAELGEELPVMKPMLKTLKAVREKVGTVEKNREDLAALQERCTYMAACFIVKYRRNPGSEMDISPVEGCVEAALKFVDRCSRRGKVSRVLKASSDKDEIAELNTRVDRMTADLGLVGIAILEGKADNMKAMLQRVLTNQQAVLMKQHSMLERLLRSTPAKQAMVPKGAPACKSWHVERRDVMNTVFNALTDGAGPRLVGLVGHSGSGKTTAASEIVRSTEVREAFPDGIVWLTVNDHANGRLSSLMLQLAHIVYEDIGGSVGCAPSKSTGGAAYVKQRMMGVQGGTQLKCLVVADNVWEKEVVSKLLEIGMWVLLTARDEGLVTGAQGEAVGVDRLSKADAESVLRKAAELDPEVRLPDDAVHLIELCGRVAMDLAFVGRWSTVRGRQDRSAWAAAVGKVRAEMGKLGGDRAVDITAGSIRANRRKAILRAGFEDLATGSDDERVPRLYLSLAVLPDGHGFTVEDAAVLLYDGTLSDEDKASARVVVEYLERWSVLGSSVWYSNYYFMHDAHLGFARESLMDRGHVCRPALERWTKHLSSLDTLRANCTPEIERNWLAVEQVGGVDCQKTRPYAAALAGMDDSDPLLWQSMLSVVNFQERTGDWEGALATGRRVLQVGAGKVGQEDVGFYMLTILRCVATAFRTGGRLGEAEELVTRCLGIKEAKLDPENVLVPHALYGLGVCVREAGRLGEAEELLRRCLGIKEATLGPEGVGVADTLYELGVCVRLAGRLGEAEELLRRCLGIAEAELGPEDVGVAYKLLGLGVCVREAGRLEEAEELLRRCLGIKEAALGPDDVEVAYTLYELGACVRLAGRLGEAEELLMRCLRIELAKLGPEDVLAPTTLYELGVCARLAGRLEEAEAFLTRCLGIADAELGPEDVLVAHTLYELGVCAREAGRLEEVEEFLTRCLGIKEAKLGPEDVGVADTLIVLGEYVREAGRLEEAEELLTRCLGIKEAKLGPEDVGVADTLIVLGECVREAGRLEEAEELLTRCLGIKEAKLDPDDVGVAYTLYELGVCVQEAGRLEEAEELLMRCLGIEEAALGPDDMGVAYTLYELGACIRLAGRLEEAEELLRRCLGIKEAALGPDDVGVADTLCELGACIRLAGRLGEAEELLMRCLGIEETKLGPEDVGVAYTLHELGVCVREAGRLEEAEELLMRCLGIKEAKLGPKDVMVADSLHHLGVLFRETGRLGEAEALLRRSLAIQEATSRVGHINVQVDDTLRELDRCVRRVGRLGEAEGCAGCSCMTAVRVLSGVFCVYMTLCGVHLWRHTNIIT